MNVFKKVIRWTPIVTLATIALMYMGWKGYAQWDDHRYGDRTWASDPWVAFSMNDVRSMFGHKTFEHWGLNSLALLFYGTPIELLLKKKWKYIMVLAFVMLLYLCGEAVINMNGAIGASGWLMAMPGLLVFVAAWRINSTDEDVTDKFGLMFMPMLGFGLSLLGTNEDLKGLRSGDTAISYIGHLTGAGIGMAMALIAVAIYVPKWLGQVIRERKEEKAWKQRYAAMGY